MSKLFDDSEVFQKERPTKITDGQKKDYYEKIATEIKKRGWSDSDVNVIAEDLGSLYNHNLNGYEIAKELEGFNAHARYEIDSDFVSFLDDFFDGISNILNKNIEEWVVAHKPTPNENRKGGTVIPYEKVESNCLKAE